MANNLALGVVIGGAISSTVGAAFKDVEGRIKKLSDQGTKARVLQNTIGDTIRLRDEWKKAHDTGSASADGLLKKLESNLRTLKDQGVEVSKLRNEYQKLGQVARGAELKALGHTQIKQGKDGLKGSLGQATALSAAIAIPTKISGDYQAQMRQMSLWAHTAGTEDEGKMATMVSTIADKKGMSRQVLAQAVGGLIEKGVEWEEASDYASQIADLIDGQGMEAETIATLINSFKEAGVKKEDMAGMLGQVAAAGDIGAFGPKDMARYGIVTPKRIAAFIAQIGHESGHLTRLVESLNYRADRIIALGNAASPGSRWRSLVPRAAELAGSSARMGNAVYGGRMGNGPEASGEGFIYRGRGLIQNTGKDNYRACGEALGVDLINHPELLEQPQYAALSAAWYWSVNGLNTLADAGDIQNIGSLINTGSKGRIPNGAADRLALYQTALRVLA